MEDTPLRPDRLVELANAFRGAKALMSSVELGVFAALAGSALCGDDLRLQLGLAERGARDFFETVLRPAIGSLQIHSIVASSRSKRRHTPTMRAMPSANLTTAVRLSRSCAA